MNLSSIETIWVDQTNRVGTLFLKLIHICCACDVSCCSCMLYIYIYIYIACFSVYWLYVYRGDSLTLSRWIHILGEVWTKFVEKITRTYCGETSAWPGTCANFNPRNLAPPKHHARLRCASFGWHVRQRKSYPHGQAMPQKHWSKNAKVLGQKKLCWKCWGKKVYAGHASHTLAHCFQEMSACMIADI